MILYLNDNKVQINIDGILYNINVSSDQTFIEGVVLLTSEGLILKDIRDLYLTAEEEE